MGHKPIAYTVSLQMGGRMGNPMRWAIGTLVPFGHPMSTMGYLGYSGLLFTVR